jgi:hypothetical protein
MGDTNESPFEKYGEHVEVPVCACEAELTSTSDEPVVNAKSSSDEAEECLICLNIFTTQEVGIPNCCNHTFCCTCIQEWSKALCSVTNPIA